MSSEVVVCETLLVGAEFVAWGASSKLKGFRDRGHRGFADGTRVRWFWGYDLLCHDLDGV